MTGMHFCARADRGDKLLDEIYPYIYHLTRSVCDEEMPETAMWVVMKLPPIEEIEGDTAGGIRRVRAQEGANT